MRLQIKSERLNPSENIYWTTNWSQVCSFNSVVNIQRCPESDIKVVIVFVSCIREMYFTIQIIKVYIYMIYNMIIYILHTIYICMYYEDPHTLIKDFFVRQQVDVTKSNNSIYQRKWWWMRCKHWNTKAFQRMMVILRKTTVLAVQFTTSFGKEQVHEMITGGTVSSGNSR